MTKTQSKMMKRSIKVMFTLYGLTVGEVKANIVKRCANGFYTITEMQEGLELVDKYVYKYILKEA